jgi:predicted nicotinamide N-methyase
MMTNRTREILTHLGSYLQSRIPGSTLVSTELPQVPELSLYLLGEDYPRDRLTREEAEALMDNPPYWCFCWASGQVLARFVLDNPDRVKGKTLVDFGSGSGVVGIAAKMAGAGRVILCDLDEGALRAGELNASVNGVEVELSAAIDTLLAEDCGDWILTVADVFYDRDNLPLLETLRDRFVAVLVSDSRLKGRLLPGMDIVGEYDSHTVPDVHESSEFNRVTLYLSCRTRRL